VVLSIRAFVWLPVITGEPRVPVIRPPWVVGPHGGANRKPDMTNCQRTPY
jgi:hypothetical protein